MAYARQISQFVDDQLPDFIQDEAPLFADFLQAYYEYLEQSDEALGKLRTLTENQDIDTATDEFVNFYYDEIVKDLPKTVLADKPTLIKNIKQLYRSKGSQNAYRFLFRLIFDENVEFTYPGERILRASDGRFDRTTKLRVLLSLDGLPTDAIGGETVVGSTSGTRGVVERTEVLVESGINVTVLDLVNVEGGSFIDGEAFTVLNSAITGTVNATIGPVADLTVIDGGGQHVLGDTVRIDAPVGGSGTGATARITGTTDQSAIQFRVVEGGSGYRANVIYSTAEGGGTNIPAITGGSGTGASFRVVSISDTQNLDINTDQILELQNVKLSEDPFSNSASIGANVNATIASANVDTTLTTALTFTNSGTIGSIDEIEIIDPGFAYSTLPTVTPVDRIVQELLGTNFPDDTGVGGFKGSNAVIVANNLFGAITDLEVLTTGSAYSKDNEQTLVNLTSSNTFNGTATVVPTGISNTVGAYTDANRGIIGGDNVLQDNFFYQEYSYVLKSRVGLDLYRNVVNRLLHPAGTKLFAFQTIDIEVDVGVPTFESVQVDIDLSGVESIAPTSVVGGFTPISPFASVPLNQAPTFGDFGSLNANSQIYDSFLAANVSSTIESALGAPRLNYTVSTTGFALNENIDTIDAMQDVNLNQVPFSNDPEIGTAFANLAGSSVSSTLEDALSDGALFGIPTVS